MVRSRISEWSSPNPLRPSQILENLSKSHRDRSKKYICSYLLTEPRCSNFENSSKSTKIIEFRIFFRCLQSSSQLSGSESNYAKPPDVPPLLWPPLQWIFKISKVQFFKSTVKSTSKYPVAAVTIERTFFDDILTASYCHRCHKRTLPTILAEFQSARNELGRQKSCKMTKIATTPEGPRTDFSSIFHPNPQKSMQLDFKPAREAF